MRKIIFFSALFLSLASVQAEDVLTVNSITVPQNGTAALEINGTFDSNFTQFELLIELPNGLSLTLNKNNRPWAEMGDHSTDHTIASSILSANAYKFVGSSMNQEALPSGGVLMRVMVQAAEGLEIGTTLQGTVKEILFNENTGGANIGHNFDDIPFSVTIGEPEDPRTILDENDTDLPEEGTNVDVRVLRTINANEWSTICLPFDMTTEQINTAFPDMTVELADADSYETIEDDDENIVGINIMFNNVEPLAIEANHPYLIRVSSSVTNFVVDGVDVSPAARERNRRIQIGNKSYFIGNYESETEVPEFGLFLSGNKFWYSVGATKIKAFRGYFDLNDVLTEVEEAKSRVAFSFKNNSSTTTGIAEIEDGRWKTEDSVYDLQGRRLKSQISKLKPQIIIVNGKKVVIR